MLIFRKLLFLALLSFAQSLLIGQMTITGVVQNEFGEVIPTGNALLYEINDTLSPQTFTRITEGAFELKTTEIYESARLQIKSFGYTSIDTLLYDLQLKKSLKLSFKLLNSTIDLKEVVVEARRKAYIRKKDTMEYRVESYSNGGERKIDEVIANLPGITINEVTGEIKYNNRPVETVLLDGDNLFETNYTLGTRNINADIVDAVQAINNFSENTLLAGIEGGDKVALNLKLKKKVLSVSANAEASSGIFLNNTFAQNTNLNLIGVSNNNKSFSTVSYNNIGENNTPFDYFGFRLNQDQNRQEPLLAHKIIPESQFVTPLGSRRTNINNQLFANYNGIFKTGKNTSYKANIFLLKDELTSNQLFQNDFSLNNESFSTLDDTEILKSPFQARGDMEVKIKTSPMSLLEYNLKLKHEEIETESKTAQNGVLNFNSNLKSKNSYLYQNLLFTNKINKSNAFQISLLQTSNFIPQTYVLSPEISNNEEVKRIQESMLGRNVLEASGKFLVSKDRSKMHIKFGVNHKINPYKSLLKTFTSNAEQSTTSNINNLVHTQFKAFNSGRYTYKNKRFRILGNYEIAYVKQILKEPYNAISYPSQQDFLLEPSIKLEYELNPLSKLEVNGSINYGIAETERLYNSPVIISNRGARQNIPSLELQSTKQINLLYSNSMIKSNIDLTLSSSLIKDKGNFFSDSNISENLTQITYFFLPENNTTWTNSLKTIKYVHSLRSSFQLDISYTRIDYKNIVNNSGLRNNRSEQITQQIFWKTVFDIPFNFENKLVWFFSQSKGDQSGVFINESIHNRTRVFYKPNKRWFASLDANYYLPNVNKKNNAFFFLDLYLRHRPIKKPWEASLRLQNITNNVNFEQVQTSDTSTSIYRSNLLTGYAILSFSYNF